MSTPIVRPGAKRSREDYGLRFFAGLSPRLKSIEPAGESPLITATLAGGLKHLPSRYSLR